METVNLKINVTPTKYNDWPLFRVLHNNIIMWDSKVTRSQIIDIDLSCSIENHLRFEHYGKRFGENNIWDTDPDNLSNDRMIKINDIRLNDASVGLELIRHWIFNTVFTVEQLKYLSAKDKKNIEQMLSFGSMNFNGYIDFNFELPVYDWLIINKYKRPIQDAAFFSNYTTRWHYDEDLKLISEIKNLMNLK